MIDALKEVNHKKLKNKIAIDELGEMSSTIYSSAFALGGFIGPLLGGFLVSAFEFPRSSSILGLFIVGFSLIYLALGKVIQCPSKKDKNNQGILENDDNSDFKLLVFGLDNKNNSSRESTHSD